MGLVVPPEGLVKNNPFPNGERAIPSNLLTPLLNWHKRLGIPVPKIIEGELADAEPTLTKLTLSPEVKSLYYKYDDALRDILLSLHNPDFDGNYARFPEKALRISALFASLSGDSEIQLHHWAKALGIVERWRSGLHSLYKQVNGEANEAKYMTDEQKVRKAITEKTCPTKREIQQYTGLNAKAVDEILKVLKQKGDIEAIKTGKTYRYPFKDTYPSQEA